MYTSISILTALVATAVAKNIVITAGSGGLVFSPDSTTADVGDVLEFHFVSDIHTVVQGDFSTPCAMGSLSSTGFDSGSVTSSDVFQVTVQSTDPIWFFCSTPGHCQSGMVGVVNPPSSGNTLAAYQAAAAKTSTSSSAGKVQGGSVIAAGSSGSSSSSGPSPSPSQSTPPASGKSTTSGPSTAATQTSSTPASGSGSASQSPGASTAASASGSAASSPSASASSSPSATPKASTGTANSIAYLGGKVVLVSLMFGLGGFVGLIA